MKKLLPIIVFCWGVLFSPKAFADFEFVELVVNILKEVEAYVQTAEKTMQTYESWKNKVAQGPLGSLLTQVKNLTSENMLQQQNKQPKVIAEGLDANDVNKLEDAFKLSIPNYELKNQVNTSLAGEAANEEYLRNYLSQMYAYAFTLRTNMEKDRQDEPEDPVELTDEVRPTSLLRDESIEAVYRVNRILLMQSSLEELRNRVRLRGMYIDKDEEE